ncbi:MAG: VOC family protein [Nitrospiraceae bacterium]
MKVLEIGFVCYPVTDMKRARTFYEGVLGLKESRFFGDDKQGFVEYDIGPGTLALGNGVAEWKPADGGGCAALEVDDFPSAIAQLKAAGCRMKMDAMETPVCHMVVVYDPDGNSVVIHKRK